MSGLEESACSHSGAVCLAGNVGKRESVPVREGFTRLISDKDVHEFELCIKVWGMVVGRCHILSLGSYIGPYT